MSQGCRHLALSCSFEAATTLTASEGPGTAEPLLLPGPGELGCENCGWTLVVPPSLSRGRPAP